MFTNMEQKRNYLREKSVDWAIEKMTKNYNAEARNDERFQAQLRRLYDKQAELIEYWRNRD